MTKEITVKYYRGHKLINKMLINCDMFQHDGEGVFWKEQAVLTFKKKTKITKTLKNKIKEAMIKSWDSLGFEINNITFSIEI